MAGNADTYIVDVGGVFDALTRQYDHHQSTFTETYDERSTVPLSSAGLVYKYHGYDVLRKFVSEVYPSMFGKINIPTLKDKVYDGWVKHIDANDNGVSVCTGATRFAVSSAIYSRVGRMNIRWNNTSRDTEDEAFVRAADMVINEFLDFVDTTVNDHFLTESIINDAIAMSAMDASILCLPCHCPWKGHVARLEKCHGRSFSYIAYPEDGPTGKWRLHAIPAGGFMNRFVIPTHFRSAPGISFIHNAGFIAVGDSMEAILNLGKLAVDYHSPSM